MPTVGKRLRLWKRHVQTYIDCRRRLNKATPILVYQVGKVGSSSIYDTLSSQWPGLVLQCHRMDRTHRPMPELDFVKRHVIERLRPVNVISLTREPISRNVSAFFENFERFTGVRFADSKFTVPELINIFLEKYEHEAVLEWFDRHLKPVFGIDVYEKRFPEEGFQRYERANTRLLVLRAELADSAKAVAIGQFLNVDGLTLSRSSNVGAAKAYAETYREFLKMFTPPDWYVRQMHESQYFKHFYAAPKAS